MASLSSSVLVPYHDGFKFHSHKRLCMLLGISSPYSTCIAYAPYARAAPHCSRPINRGKKARVPGLLSDLLQASVPSSQARRLLEELSTHVVCGITGWHQNKATEVYYEWCDTIWDEYLRVNGVDPRGWNEPPRQLSRHTWEVDLEVAQREQQCDSDEGDDDDSRDNDSDSEESVATADTTTSDFGESSSDRDIPSQSQSLQTTDYLSVHSRQPPSGSFSVYRDPEVQSVNLVPSNTASVCNRPALRPLDQNIAVSRAGSQTLPEWSHAVIDAASSSSDVSHPVESPNADSRNATPQLGSDTGHTLSDDERPVISDDEASGTPEDTEDESEDQDDSEDEEAESDSHQLGSDGEEQTPDGADDLQDQSEHSEGIDADSAQYDAEEDFVLVETSDGGHDEESQSSHTSAESEATAEDTDEDSFATDLLSLHDGIFEDADVTEVASTPAPAPADLTPPPALIAPHLGFRLYPQAPGPLPQLKQLLNTLTQTVSPGRRHTGFIYAFSRPSLPGHLKIGYVKDVTVPRGPYSDRVDCRLAKWQADCGHPVANVFSVWIACNAVERIESLVHLTLREHRRVEDPPCGRCQRRKGRGSGGGSHDEWFEVDERTARRVVGLWALFAEQLPYDRFGRLVDFWSEKVDGEKRRVSHGDTTMNWLEAMPRLVEELTRWELGNIIGPFRGLSL